MENIAPALLEWFYKNHRVLPFRTDPTPYHVWLSEIMLQQTRVSAALPYYERFLAALPDIPALAACEEEPLHKLWEGLGYYSRVRNLQKAAKIVCEQYGGELPADYEALKALPGIGDYTAGAIASISFGLPVPAVDGNVLRVFSRLYNDPGVITEPKVKKAFTQRVMAHQPPDAPGDYTAGAIASISFGLPVPAVDGNVLRVFSRLYNDPGVITEPKVKKAFTQRVMAHQPQDAPGDYNQALMELGALVCVPNGAPLCGQCPVAAFCRARAAGTAPELPKKAAPKARRLEALTVALIETDSPIGPALLIQQRPEKGLLAGLWQPVLWEDGAKTEAQLRAALTALGFDGAAARVEPLPKAKHIFSHIEWQMTGYAVHVPPQPAPAGTVWASRSQLRSEYTLPGAFKAYKKRLGLA